MVFQIINTALRKRRLINNFETHENNSNAKNIFICYEKKISLVTFLMLIIVLEASKSFLLLSQVTARKQYPITTVQ